MAKKEIYISTDIEADGPIPGPFSMLSMASVALDIDKNELAVFEANLETLPDAGQDERVMKWWQGFPEAWARCRENPRSPERVMADYLTWLEALPGKPVFIGWPAAWDFMWIYWYLMKFTGQRPFTETALDIRSFAMAQRQTDFLRTGKAYLPQRWFDDLPVTHVALDDARAQGMMFINMLRENRSLDAQE